ncbi:sugar transferase [Nocardia sp. NPDC088792]|uniref:sugar transferase n=1 Tax=Nocardia sp. NPDC088792 TaxID=3364332 RepID=UPI00380EEF00
MEKRFHASPGVPVGILDPAARVPWQSRFAKLLFVTDLTAVSLALLAGHYLHIAGPTHNPLRWSLTCKSGNIVASLMITAGWVVSLTLWGARSKAIVGHRGAEERAVLLATLALFGIVGIGSQILQIGGMRDYLGIALPLGTAGLIAGRWTARRYLTRRRADGHCLTSVLLVGSPEATRNLAHEFARDSTTGYRVVGACTPDGRGDGGNPTICVAGRTIPVVGDNDSLQGAVVRTGADMVAMLATDASVTTDFRRIVWDLDAVAAGLLVAPGITDVPRDRLSDEIVSDLLVIQVDKPNYSHALSLRKAVFDRCFAAVAVLITLPFMVAIAAAIKLTSKGPVFYLSERIGLRGEPFRMIKFRSMRVGAETHAESLIAETDSQPLFFKIRDDPRITPIGRLIRKYSLDELPQFLNVLCGDMSVVGPRPQVRREVAVYDAVACRRLLVKPGITGLWQVSGRSDLSPAESIGLDTYYVDNWSMRLDVSIIARTLRTVSTGAGAY